MSKKLEDIELNYSQPKVYSQPKIYSLGSIDQVQSYYQGRYIEGPNERYWYS